MAFRLIGLLFLLLTIMVIAGCGGSSHSSSDTVQLAEMRVAQQWIYDVTDSENPGQQGEVTLTVQSTGIESHGRRYWRITEKDTNCDSVDLAGYYAKNSDCYKQYLNADYSTPYVPVLLGDNGYFHYIFHVNGITPETVTVPAGTFIAYKITTMRFKTVEEVIEGEDSPGIITTNCTEWYVPEIGWFVKQVAEYPAPQKTVTMELKSTDQVVPT